MVALFALTNKQQGPISPRGLEVNLKLGNLFGPSWVDQTKPVPAFLSQNSQWLQENFYVLQHRRSQ